MYSAVMEKVGVVGFLLATIAAAAFPYEAAVLCLIAAAIYAVPTIMKKRRR